MPFYFYNQPENLWNQAIMDTASNIGSTLGPAISFRMSPEGRAYKEMMSDPGMWWNDQTGQLSENAPRWARRQYAEQQAAGTHGNVFDPETGINSYQLTSSPAYQAQLAQTLGATPKLPGPPQATETLAPNYNWWSQPATAPSAQTIDIGNRGPSPPVAPNYNWWSQSTPLPQYQQGQIGTAQSPFSLALAQYLMGQSPVIGREEGGPVDKPSRKELQDFLAVLNADRGGIPVIAHPGEYVLNADAVQAIGEDRLEAINERARAGDPNVIRAAETVQGREGARLDPMMQMDILLRRNGVRDPNWLMQNRGYYDPQEITDAYGTRGVTGPRDMLWPLPGVQSTYEQGANIKRSGIPHMKRGGDPEDEYDGVPEATYAATVRAAALEKAINEQRAAEEAHQLRMANDPEYAASVNRAALDQELSLAQQRADAELQSRAQAEMAARRTQATRAEALMGQAETANAPEPARPHGALGLEQYRLTMSDLPSTLPGTAPNPFQGSTTPSAPSLQGGTMPVVPQWQASGYPWAIPGAPNYQPYSPPPGFTISREPTDYPSDHPVSSDASPRPVGEGEARRPAPPAPAPEPTPTPAPTPTPPAPTPETVEKVKPDPDPTPPPKESSTVEQGPLRAYNVPLGQRVDIDWAAIEMMTPGQARDYLESVANAERGTGAMEHFGLTPNREQQMTGLLDQYQGIAAEQGQQLSNIYNTNAMPNQLALQDEALRQARMANDLGLAISPFDIMNAQSNAYMNQLALSLAGDTYGANVDAANLANDLTRSNIGLNNTQMDIYRAQMEAAANGQVPTMDMGERISMYNAARDTINTNVQQSLDIMSRIESPDDPQYIQNALYIGFVTGMIDPNNVTPEGLQQFLTEIDPGKSRRFFADTPPNITDQAIMAARDAAMRDRNQADVLGGLSGLGLPMRGMTGIGNPTDPIGGIQVTRP